MTGRDLERHFLRPWSELAAYLEGLVGRPGHAVAERQCRPQALEEGPAERTEDVEFCIAYGLDDDPEEAEGPVGGPPAHSGNGKA